MTTDEMRMKIYKVQTLYENGFITLLERNTLLIQLSDLFIAEWKKILDK